MGRAGVLIASSLWIAASLTPAWAAGPGDAGQGGDYIQGAFAQPYPFFLDEKLDSSPYRELKGLRLAPSRASSSTVPDGKVPALQGVIAQYEEGLGNQRVEFSGGYVPVTKYLIPSESPLDSRAYLSYINLTIPLSQFYLKGGAILGQHLEALGLTFKRPSENQEAKNSEFLGYQFGGGYRFSDSLSIHAGWGQAAQEYELSREDLGAWYLQAQISLGWWMSVTPHVGFVDITTGDREKTKEEGFYCGVRWQINF